MYPESLQPESVRTKAARGTFRHLESPRSAPRDSASSSCANAFEAASNRWFVLTLLLMGSALLGCTAEQPIVTYKIPTKVPDELLPGNERLLAIMVPRDDQVWFFKIKGPEKSVELVADTFKQFVAEVTFSDRNEPIMKPLPKAWRLGGQKPMRFASVDITTPGKQLDLSVSSLPAPREWDDYVSQNVNRWRKQVSLETSEDKWAGGDAIEIASAKGEAVFVDIAGKAASSSMGSGRGMRPGMSGPFSGGPMTGSASAVTDSGEGKSSSTAKSPPPKASKLEYDRPDGWRDGKMSMMREAAFNVGPEDAVAEVTVITATGNVRDNVSRWMGQVLGGAPGEEALDAMLESVEKLKVSGLDGQRFIIAGDPEKDQKSIDVTLVPMGTATKFIKMTGPPETVADASDSMRAFLGSLSF